MIHKKIVLLTLVLSISFVSIAQQTPAPKQTKSILIINAKTHVGNGTVIENSAIGFKNGKIDQFLNQIDLKHIVLETDSPYLAPIPFRGKRNESSYLINVAAKLAQIYNLSEEEIASITTENSKVIFGI